MLEWSRNKTIVTLCASVVCSLFILASDARSEHAEVRAMDAPETLNLIERPNLLGEWGGARTWLRDRGLDFELIYISEVFMNTRGGLNTNDAHEYRGDISLYMELDTERAGWWDNGRFFMTLQEAHGKGISADHVGDYQCVSNIDADDFKQISEIGYQHYFLDEKLWLKLGKMEATNDFGCPLYGYEFLHSCPGISPAILLPTYPDQDWGVVLGTAPVDWFSMSVGVYQGDFDGGRSLGATLDSFKGPAVLVEPAFHYNLWDREGLVRVGGWWNGVETDRLDEDSEEPGLVDEQYGYYINLDQMIWKESPQDAEDDQGLAFFAQYAWAPEDRSEVVYSVSSGIQWIGAIPGRDADAVGAGAFHVEFSNEAGYEEDGETAFELFYKYQATGWMSLKPDVQYIVNPGGMADRDAVAVGLRAEVSF